MSESKEGKSAGLKETITGALTHKNPELLCDALIDADEILQEHKSIYRVPSERMRLLKDIKNFLASMKEGDYSSYVFYLSGQMNRLRIFAEPDGVKIDMSPNSFPDIVEKWEKLK